MSNQRHLHLPAVYRHVAPMPSPDATQQQPHELPSANSVSVLPHAPPPATRCNVNDIPPVQPGGHPPAGHGIPAPQFHLNVPLVGHPPPHVPLRVAPTGHPPSYSAATTHGHNAAHPLQVQSQWWLRHPQGTPLHVAGQSQRDCIAAPNAGQTSAFAGHSFLSGHGPHGERHPSGFGSDAPISASAPQFPHVASTTPPTMALAVAASPPGSSCFVGNIPPDISSEYLQSLFVPICPQATARIHRDKRYAFVTLASPSAAHDAARRLNGVEVGGRLIRVEVTQRVPRYVLQQQLTFEHIQQHTQQFRMAQQQPDEQQQQQQYNTAAPREQRP